LKGVVESRLVLESKGMIISKYLLLSGFLKDGARGYLDYLDLTESETIVLLTLSVPTDICPDGEEVAESCIQLWCERGFLNTLL
jgi:hypothetical protein